MSKDAKGFYALLGVPENADGDEIKAAYRRLVKIYHPDRNQEDGATEKYLRLNEAYRVLSNPEARKAYDRPRTGNDGFVPCHVCGIHAKQPRYILFDEGGVFRSGVFCRPCASKQQLRSALTNWRHIFFHPWRTIKALRNNLAVGEKPFDGNVEILMQNAAAFRCENRPDLARFLAVQAKSFAQTSAQRAGIDAFLSALPDTPKRQDDDYWKIRWTDVLRVYFPLFAAVIVASAVIFTPTLRQAAVRLQVFDVADYKYLPVMPIKVNPSDETLLFHTEALQTPAYQAPCKDCGIVEMLEEQTTLRITGTLFQSEWVQVMTPHGKIVFVKIDDLKKGRGSKPLPYHSKITRTP